MRLFVTDGLPTPLARIIWALKTSVPPACAPAGVTKTVTAIVVTIAAVVATPTSAATMRRERFTWTHLLVEQDMDLFHVTP
jgi:hypothetical protein